MQNEASCWRGEWSDFPTVNVYFNIDFSPTDQSQKCDSWLQLQAKGCRNLCQIQDRSGLESATLLLVQREVMSHHHRLNMFSAHVANDCAMTYDQIPTFGNIKLVLNYNTLHMLWSNALHGYVKPWNLTSQLTVTAMQSPWPF